MLFKIVISSLLIAHTLNYFHDKKLHVTFQTDGISIVQKN